MLLDSVSFDSDADFNLSDPFVRARALAVQSGLPGAVFRWVLLLHGLHAVDGRSDALS